MSTTVYFGNVTKRRNSTLQPTVSISYDCILKEATSLDHPTFILEHSGTFTYNYCKWDNTYYFVDDVISRRNNIWEVSCVMDVLATYKTEILASTQYVAYSSQSGNTWLADTRIPVLKSTIVSKATASMSGLFNTNGFYVLSVIGKNGCETLCVNKSTLHALIADIQNWQDNSINAIVNAIPSAPSGSSSTEEAIEALAGFMSSLQEAAVKSDFIGNAFANAPACIRSCIWVPFSLASFSGGSRRIWLGNFETSEAGFELNASPTTGSVTVSIPWHFTDWRRGYCEDVYLYLPLVGMVGISADSLTHATSITVKYSATGTDGTVCYQVISGNEIIGSYGGQCSANYPIGINQQASAGEVVTSVAQGLSKTVGAAINSSISPVSVAGAVAGVALEGAVAGYDVVQTASSTHLSCIGGIGGGAGVGLDLGITCYTVAHETVIAPADMKDTMGLPTMKPMILSGLSGYCQCANAHVAAPAAAHELDAIDTFLNSGFFIE